jgi:hypothetical protein
MIDGEIEDPKVIRMRASIEAERVLRRVRIRAAGHDPDAYPRQESDCHHPYFRPNGQCYACGYQSKEKTK